MANEPRTSKRWWFGYAKTHEMLTEAYQKAIPNDQKGVYRPEYMADMSWSSGRVPSNVGNVMSNANRVRLESLINSLINCGCGGAKADLQKAISKLDFIEASSTLKQGMKDLISHAGRNARIQYFKRIK